jgi:hypothetical protein
MLRIPLTAMQAIEQGVKPEYAVTVYFQQPETYTENDYLLSVGGLRTAMSEGRYEIANTSITLSNEKKDGSHYFSRKFGRELPNNKLVEVYMLIAGERILVQRGVVNKNWTLNEMKVTLNINA